MIEPGLNAKRRHVIGRCRAILKLGNVQLPFKLVGFPPFAHLAGEHRFDVAAKAKIGQRRIDLPVAELQPARDNRANPFHRSATLHAERVVRTIRAGESRPSIAMLPREIK